MKKESVKGIHRSVDVSPRDFYQTPEKAVYILKKFIEEKFDNCKAWDILDPCAGTNVFKKVFKDYKMTCLDIYPQNMGIIQYNFLDYDRKHDVVIMNSPYKLKKQFLYKAKELSRYTFSFLPLMCMNYIDMTTEFFDTSYYLGQIIVYPKMILNTTQEYKQGGTTAYAWCIFDWGRTGCKEEWEEKKVYYKDMRKIKMI